MFWFKDIYKYKSLKKKIFEQKALEMEGKKLPL